MSSYLSPTDLGGGEPAQKGRRLFLPGFLPGLRGRLLLAFFLISLFVIVAAAAGLYALHRVGQTLDRITLETVPVTLDAQELLRNAQKIVRTLLAVFARDESLQMHDQSLRGE